eukprot:CAMPEP_0178768530 /NCGR_PEP_ID=MMETSP0744-20121128/20294_1 /TAXON_ID=913974 /ORGANISM="Nitzschia punctata, Strain CCMP561" /LENGTH=129 /DNA_ID=CAMNT_0020424619 /DNA_START=49 /DNA_END=435 /DNA_ORIENTATION=-
MTRTNNIANAMFFRRTPIPPRHDKPAANKMTPTKDRGIVLDTLAHRQRDDSMRLTWTNKARRSNDKEPEYSAVYTSSPNELPPRRRRVIRLFPLPPPAPNNMDIRESSVSQNDVSSSSSNDLAFLRRRW